MVVEYNSKERLLLWCLSLFSFFTINVVFLYALFFDPDSLVGAMRNPVSAAFIVEAFLLMGALSYLLTKWGVCKLSWRWFIVLSLLGSMGFALPIVLLGPLGKPKNAKT
jgi:hypothetical protein